MCGESKEAKRACAGEEATAFGRTPDALVKVAGQMYAMFMGPMAGGGGKISSSETASTSGVPTEGANGVEMEAAVEAKDDSMTDYCGYIPVFTTIGARVTQSHQHQMIGTQAKSQGGSQQREYLYKTARTHRSRAKTAGIETLGWMGATTCYTGIAAAKYQFKVNRGTLVKMGAAAFLTYFYNLQRKNHKKYADITKKIADSLPGKGDCNPITEKDCYCAQEETANDSKYCLPPGQEALANGMLKVSCVDAQMRPDPNCDCATDGTCADQNFRQLLSMPDFAPQTTGGKVIQDTSRLANGQFNPSRVNDSAIGQGAFKRALRLADKNLPTEHGPLLNQAQKETAQALMQAGIPKRLANRMARVPVSGQGKKFAAKLRKGLPPSIKTKASPAPRFFPRRPFAKKAKRNPSAQLPFQQKAKKDAAYDNEVIQFAQKAQDQASISQRKENLFKLISHRYQNSGWNRVEFDMP